MHHPASAAAVQERFRAMGAGRAVYSAGFLGLHIPVVDDAIDFAASITDGVGQALVKFGKGGPVGDLLSSKVFGPIARAVMDVVLTAFSSGVYAALVPAVGAQFAAAAFAIPGLLRGDRFVKAWFEGFLDRLQATLQILGPTLRAEIAEKVSAELGPTISKIESELPDLSQFDNVQLPKLPVLSCPDLNEMLGLPPDASPAETAKALGVSADSLEDLAKSAGMPDLSVVTLAAKYDVRQDVAMWAKGAVLKILPPPDLHVDALTGLVWTDSDSYERRALGIPQGDPMSSAFPAPGSWGYLSPNLWTILGSSGPVDPKFAAAWPPGARVTVVADVTPDYVPGGKGTWFKVRNAQGATADIPWTGMSANPPAAAPTAPPPPQMPTTKVPLSPDGSVLLRDGTTMTALGQWLAFLKANKSYVLIAPPVVIRWFGDQGLPASRFELPPSPRDIALAPDGSIARTPDATAKLGKLLLFGKLYPTVVLNAPPAVARWLVDQGLDSKRVTSAAPVPAAPSGPRVPLVVQGVVNATVLKSGDPAWVVAAYPGGPPVGTKVTVAINAGTTLAVRDAKGAMIQGPISAFSPSAPGAPSAAPPPSPPPAPAPVTPTAAVPPPRSVSTYPGQYADAPAQVPADKLAARAYWRDYYLRLAA